MKNEQVESISRLVVALDASPCSQLVFRSAARIAAGLGVGLQGLFVEDIHLFQVTDLPICQEVLIGSAAIRPLDRPALERDLRMLSEQTEAWAAAIAGEHDLAWRFQVRRGNITQELMSAAGKGDLLSLGRFGRSLFPQPSRLGSVARALVDQHPFPLLLLDCEIQSGQPVLAIFDGSAADIERLSVAAQLSRIYKSRLIVLLQSEDEQAAASRQRQADLLLAEHFSGNRLLDVRYLRVDAQNLLWQIKQASAEQGGILLSRRHIEGILSLPLALILI
jgi:nucleotide-binding universal stress UspA family protein